MFKLKKLKYKIAFPLYCILFFVLSLYIPFFFGCSLIMRLFSHIMPEMMYNFFVIALKKRIIFTLPFVNLTYFTNITISTIIYVCIFLVNILELTAVIVYIVKKQKRETDFSPAPKKIGGYGFKKVISWFELKLSKLCRFNC